MTLNLGICGRRGYQEFRRGTTGRGPWPSS